MYIHKILLAFFLFPLISFGHISFERRRPLPDIITDPTPSVRCEILIKEYRYKKKAELRAKALLRRSQALSKTTPENKKSIHLQLKSSVQKLSSLIYDTKDRLRAMEENIVREGCPGLAL